MVMKDVCAPVINKHAQPTRFDSQPQYTLCRALITSQDGSETHEWYVQSGSEERIEWVSLGDFIATQITPSLSENPESWNTCVKVIFDLPRLIR